MHGDRVLRIVALKPHSHVTEQGKVAHRKRPEMEICSGSSGLLRIVSIRGWLLGHCYSGRADRHGEVHELCADHLEEDISGVQRNAALHRLTPSGVLGSSRVVHVHRDHGVQALHLRVRGRVWVGLTLGLELCVAYFAQDDEIGECETVSAHVRAWVRCSSQNVTV